MKAILEHRVENKYRLHLPFEASQEIADKIQPINGVEKVNKASQYQLSLTLGMAFDVEAVKAKIKETLKEDGVEYLEDKK